jgi:acyl-CoA thioester hydrolase
MAGVSIFRTGIAPDWIDYNGHLRDAYYGLIVSFAIDALMDRIGLDAAYRARTGCTLYTLELHMHYLREIKSTATVAAELRILGADRKRIHAAFELCCEPDPGPAAIAEVMLLHVRQAEAVSSEPFTPATAAAIEQLREATAQLPPASHGSRRMQLPPPR